MTVMNLMQISVREGGAIGKLTNESQGPLCNGYLAKEDWGSISSIGSITWNQVLFQISGRDEINMIIGKKQLKRVWNCE